MDENQKAAAIELAESLLRYHEAIAGRAFNGDFEYTTDVENAFLRGHDLDSLYHDMMSKAHKVKAMIK